MPTGQQYATNVPQTTLTGLINATATIMSVASSSGWPATPFTAILDIATSSQEPVDVTNITGTTWTVVRAIDGTVGMTHQVGATVTHGDIGRDFREARTHMDSSVAVHGLGGGSSVVGTTDSQSLSNKTLASPSVTGTVSMGSGTWSGTGNVAESFFRFSGVSGANSQVSGLVGAFNTAATTTGPGSGTYNTGDMVVDTTFNALWICTAGGTPGTWAPLGGFVKLGTLNPSGVSSASISVPSWAKTVQGVWSARTDNAASGGYVNLRFNSDSGSNYAWEQVLAATAAVSGQNSAGTATSMHLGAKSAASDTANYFGSGTFTVPNTQSTSMFKSVTSSFNAINTTTAGYAGTGGGTWLSTAAITGITLLPDAGNFVAGSSFTLYGSA